ncbi:unnamed protein product [Urochloa decumbens]|uniref:DUF4220 domain-containing protein n=1 Tax=Urochloa decumbens TaxID=240449 RepID=A0ABC8Z9T4_9POAL
MQETASAVILAVIWRLVSLWNGWSTQFLVLFSLVLQVVLLFLAGVRRHKDGGTLIGILWLAYQLADYTTTYALGNLGASSALREHQLVAFWAPFLLLHLGGPDNIAAYEALGAGYILYKHFSRGDGTFFSLAAAFMAVIGFIKSLEKTLALRRANLSIIRDSVRTEAPAKCTYSLEYEVPQRGFNGDTAQEEEFFKRHAHTLFHVCKSAVVDSSVDDEHPNRTNHGGPDRLLRGFTEKGTKYRWKLMEMELSLMYDILYTKAAMIHTLPGYCIRVASSLAVAASLLLFWFSGKARYNRVDVVVTYILLGGALLLETTSLLRAVFSTWTFAFLCTTRWSCLRHAVLFSGRWDQLRHVVVSIHRVAYITGIAGCFRLSRRWHGTMGQCSMLDMCTLWGTHRPLSSIWARMLYSRVWTVNVPETVKDRVVKHIASIVKKGDMNTLGVIRTHWGKAALEYHGFDIIEARLGAELQEAIIIWHIATDILLAELGKLRTKDTETDVGAIKAISYYMMFLLVQRPAMLPGLAQIKLYQRTEKTLSDEWKRAIEGSAPTLSSSWIGSIYMTSPNFHSRLQRREQLAMRLLNDKPELDEYGISSRVRFGVDLSQKLVDREVERKDSVRVVLDVWTDILVYTANRCSREAHAKQLSRGGELTTIIWLMAEHRHQASG